jgi:hypothetical protein
MSPKASPSGAERSLATTTKWGIFRTIATADGFEYGEGWARAIPQEGLTEESPGFYTGAWRGGRPLGAGGKGR